MSATTTAVRAHTLHSPTIDAAQPATPAKPAAGRTMTRAQLAERIAQGETLVLHRRKIYKLDRWLERHPGGELAILHFVGRDATDEIEAYHSQHTLDVLMTRFVIAHLDPNDWDQYTPLVPPVQLGYRKGNLDHPHAQVAMWSHRSKDQPITLEPTNGQTQQPASTEWKAATTSHPILVDRPQSFPIPVQLLEPPPNPPQIQPEREKAISQAWRDMHEQIKQAGLYQLRPIGYARECSRYLLLGFTAWWFWSRGQTLLATSSEQTVSWLPFTLSSYTLSFLLSSFFLGLFWHQLTFTAHDAGHSGITHSHMLDRLIGITIADLIGGLSIGWWCDNHDVHHLVTNHPEHDPDIQHMPFFAISPKFVLAGQTTVLQSASKAPEKDQQKTKAERPLGLWSSYYRRVLIFDAPSRFFLRHQHRLYYIVMAFGRFNLYANSYGFLALKARRDRYWFLELAGLVAFWAWFGALLFSLPSTSLRIAYLLISHVVTSPLHVQIVLSHFAQSSEDLGLSESFASRQIRTTMDVDCPTWLDFVHGGLHMQVTHHLFPRLPRHNLREARDRFVKPFCDKWGLSYEEYKFVKGNGRVLDTLRKVAGQVEVLAKVADAQARGELR